MTGSEAPPPASNRSKRVAQVMRTDVIEPCSFAYRSPRVPEVHQCSTGLATDNDMGIVSGPIREVRDDLGCGRAGSLHISSVRVPCATRVRGEERKRVELMLKKERGEIPVAGAKREVIAW